MALKPIQILISAKDNASGVFDKLQSKIAAVGIAVAGYFGIRAFAGIVQGAADLEQGMSRVQAATGATAEEMVALRKAAEDVGSSGMFTSVQAAGALENLAKAGLSATDAIAALPAVTSLAAAGDVDLATSAEFVTKAVMGMGLEFSEAGRVADVLAKGANATNTSVTGLAQALSYAAPVAQSLGLSLEQTVAIIGKFADAGIDASRAGTALNSILSQFSNPASKFRSELAAAGITTTDFGQALEQLAASGPRGQSAVLAVGQEAGPALRALLNQGIGSLSELRAALEGSAGSAAATAKVMQGNLNGAISGLGAAWDTVKNTLGTPVLPVLKDGVEQLAGALRGAVADGTVAKFGEAIASAFRSAIEWVKQFVGSVDFTQVAADMRAFADRTKEAFDQIGVYATNAGDSVKLAYGVMSAGTSVVLAGVYKIGEAFAGVASNIAGVAARLSEAWAKIGFGEAAERLRREANELRTISDGLWSASEALAQKASDALASAGGSAQIARDGFSGLTGAVDSASRAQREWNDTVDKAAKAAETAATAQKTKRQADESATQALAKLRQEYAQLIASGDLQGAAEKINEINLALRGTPPAAASAASAAGASADAIKAAFERMGIQSKEALGLAADTAKADFELIKQSGQATAEGLQQAFQKYAEASISANGGAASETLMAEAAMRGLEIATDQTGKAIVRSMRDGSGAMGNLTESINEASSAAEEYVGWADRMAERNSKVGKLPPAGRTAHNGEELGEGVTEVGSGGQYKNRSGFASDAKGNTIGAATELGTLTGIANFLKQAGLDDGQAKNLAREFSDGKGNIPYLNNPGQMKYGGAASTMSEALLKAAERITFGIGNAGAAPVGRRVTHDYRINGDSYPVTLDEDDRESAGSIDALIDRLARDKRRAA